MRVFNIVIAAAVLTFASHAAQSNEPEQLRSQADAGTRIFNGEKVSSIADVPWAMSLQLDGRHHCGASFIGPEFEKQTGKYKITGFTERASQPIYALTAAHCVVSPDGTLLSDKRFTVLSGTSELAKSISSPKGTFQKVIKIIVPTGKDRIGPYNPVTFKNDIAVIVLEPAVNDDVHHTLRHSIRIPMKEDRPHVYKGYTAVHTAGWGRTETGYSSSSLRTVRLPLMDSVSCKNSYFNGIKEGMICAGYSSGKYDSCSGDSGGPLYYSPTPLFGDSEFDLLLGVVSWGPMGCGTPNKPGVYTSVLDFREWIIEKIEDAENSIRKPDALERRNDLSRPLSLASLSNDRVPSGILMERLMDPNSFVVPRKEIRDITDAAFELIKHFEGFSQVAYDDPAGYCTIGYGHLLALKRCADTNLGGFGSGLTSKQAITLLKDDIKIARHIVQKNVSTTLSDTEFSALVSFVFNVGAGQFKRSTLLRKLNENLLREAALEFGRWVYANKKVSSGLIVRRECEMTLFEGHEIINDVGEFSRDLCSTNVGRRTLGEFIDIYAGE